MASGEERTVGGEAGGVAFAPLDRVTDTNQLYQHGDARALQMDVESIEALERVFSAEFRVADEKVRAKSKTAPLLYDYQNDRRYETWQRDQAAVRERLGIHRLDDLLDHPLESLVYFGRLFTTAGLFYGLGRTAYLYRTMDHAYAKLNGVSLVSIAATEVSVAVSKGAGVAVGATVGLVAGESTANLAALVVSRDVSVPERSWYHVWCSATLSGVGAGAVFAGLHRRVLTPWGVGAALLSFTACFTAAGFYLGYAVYRPFAAQRTHRLYEPYWRPWNERLVGYGGPHHVRGRYT